MTSTEQASASDPELKESSLAWLGLSLALVLALTTLGIAIWDEPLHIDELRQVGYYDRNIRGIIDGALSQNQPPLDYLIGAAVQRVLGPEDAVWRLPGFGFAWMGLVLVGRLLRRWGVLGWLAVGLLALSPAFLEFSSYARPYALPFFLMLLTMWGFEGWRRSRRVSRLVFGSLAVLALPLSRTSEPPIFLFLTLVALLIIWASQGRDDGKWIQLPAAVTIVGLAASIAVLPAVQTGQFRPEGGINGPGVTLSRIWSDLLPVHIAKAPLGAIGFFVGLAGILVAAWLAFRRKEIGLWWISPIAFTAIGAPVAFAAMSTPTQPYFVRYAYFAAPALVLGMVILLKLLRSPRTAAAIGFVALLVSAFAAMTALSEVDRPDYRLAAEVSRPLIDAGNIVLYEQDRTIAAFRSGHFPGVPLYIPRSHAIISTELSARENLTVDPGRRPLILVLGLRADVEGWTEIRVGDQFHMLIPELDPPAWDPPEQAFALWSACQSLHPDSGSYLCVTAVSILFRFGDTDGAENYARITLDRIENPVVKARVLPLLEAISPDLIP